MREIILTVGIPASGKSKWAREQARKYPNKYKIVCKDDLRDMLDGGTGFDTTKEKFMLNTRNNIVRQAILSGYDVIVADTNFSAGGKHYLAMCDIAKSIGDVTVREKFFDISLKDALIANKGPNRNPVPDDVIINMYEKHIKNKPFEMHMDYFPPVNNATYDDSLPNCVIFDIDGTLALNTSGRSPYDMTRVSEDSSNENICDIFRMLYKHTDIKRFIFSGRDDSGKEATEKWLLKHGLIPDNLFMRKYGDSRKDNIIKKELYDENIKGKYNLIFVIDDRDQVVDFWRSEGITCLQCNYGLF